jgi:hypothetical protein
VRVRELLSLAGHTLKVDGKPRWFERDEGDERVTRDREIVRRYYPDLKYGLNHYFRSVFLDGPITLRAECGIPTHIRTRIVFPDDYPAQEPAAYEVGKMFLHIADRHFFLDGRCCLWLPVESQWKPHEATALREFLDQVATFFERQLIYDASPDKSWAWGERGHGISGYIEFAQEALGGDESLFSKFKGVVSGQEQIRPSSFCPCGSRKKFKSCHANRLATLMERLTAYNPFATNSHLQVTSSARCEAFGSSKADLSAPTAI